MDYDKGKFQYAGLRFLYETELIDDPQLVNNMKLNILTVSRCIRDVEFLSSYPQRSILIYLDMSWFGRRKFMEKRITAEVLDRVQQLLPRFRFRVVTDRKILELSLSKLAAAVKGTTGGTLEIKPLSAIVSDPAGKSGGSELPEEPGAVQHPEVAAADRPEVRDATLKLNQQVQQDVRNGPQVVSGDSNAGVGTREQEPTGKGHS